MSLSHILNNAPVADRDPPRMALTAEPMNLAVSPPRPTSSASTSSTHVPHGSSTPSPNQFDRQASDTPVQATPITTRTPALDVIREKVAEDSGNSTPEPSLTPGSAHVPTTRGRNGHATAENGGSATKRKRKAADSTSSQRGEDPSERRVSTSVTFTWTLLNVASVWATSTTGEEQVVYSHFTYTRWHS